MTFYFRNNFREKITLPRREHPLVFGAGMAATVAEKMGFLGATNPDRRLFPRSTEEKDVGVWIGYLKSAQSIVL